MDSAAPPFASRDDTPGPEAAAEDPAGLLARADALRDARDWIEAAVGYAAYLRLRPAEWPIWVQYGHCMKESGDVKAALLLYREAERLAPADSDLHLQIGHALKLLGRVEEAYQAYARALTLDPGNAAARAELLATPAGQAPPPAPEPRPEPARSAPVPEPPPAAHALPVREPVPAAHPGPAPEPPPAAPPSPPGPGLAAGPAPAAPPALPPGAPDASAAMQAGALVLDASDLIDYFRHNRAPTGIQRVQLCLLSALLDRVPEEAAAAIVAFDAAAGAWKRIPAAIFRRIAALSRQGADATAPDWTGAMTEAVTGLLQAPPFAFPAGGGRLVNLGTSWWIPDYLRRVREAKAAAPGLLYIPFLHDCIPLAVPEHCAAGLVDEFARWFAGLCLHADLVLCNSAATEADLRRFAGAVLPAGAPALPSAVVRLDAATPLDAPGAEPGMPLPAPLRSGRPYVLCVGTIESRKNHLMLFHAWAALLRRHGAAAVPDLVCVGKRGWLADAALALHANSPALQEKVVLLHGVPDPVLAALYRACLFTLQNSHHESWGLPVTESLAHGKVALVPEHSGFRESGAAGAVFFTPGSEPALLEALERLILDPGALVAAEARVTAAPPPRGWDAVAAELLRLVRGAAPLPPPLERLPPVLGTVQEPRLLPGPAPSAAMAQAEALREGAAWSVPEPWGCWTLAGTARLRLPVPAGTRGPVRAHLALVGPPAGGIGIGLRATQPGTPPAPFRRLALAPGERVVASLDLDLAADGAALELDAAEGVLLGGEGPARDLRRVAAGVLAVMACRPDDLAARLDWLERLALPRLVRL